MLTVIFCSFAELVEFDPQNKPNFSFVETFFSPEDNLVQVLTFVWIVAFLNNLTSRIFCPIWSYFLSKGVQTFDRCCM